MKFKAFLFDMNGTMIDDMRYHVHAWHRILHELGADITLQRMKAECYGKNHELIERIFPGRFTNEEKDRMSLQKELQYQREFKPQLQLIPGLASFLEQSVAARVKMAIGTAAIMSNIDFVLDGLNLRHYFDALVSADDVKHSKPHPETYLECADRLGVLPADCLVFEDSPKGVECAANAGMQAVVIATMHMRNEFVGYHNIIRIIDDYSNLSPIF